jgi:hypothetical protein
MHRPVAPNGKQAQYCGTVNREKRGLFFTAFGASLCGTKRCRRRLPASACVSLQLPGAAEAQRGYDLLCNCLSQKAFILAQGLYKSSAFLVCA